MPRNIAPPRRRPTRHAAIIALPLLAALAACGTPQQQCIARNNREYLVLSDLLATVEGNLARGYAWEERPVTTVEWRECRDVVRDREGRARVVGRPCLRDVTDIERYRVPIDPAAEARKRDGLLTRLRAMAPRAQAVSQACRTAYPEG